MNEESQYSGSTFGASIETITSSRTTLKGSRGLVLDQRFLLNISLIEFFSLHGVDWRRICTGPRPFNELMKLGSFLYPSLVLSYVGTKKGFSRGSWFHRHGHVTTPRSSMRSTVAAYLLDIAHH